MCVYVITYCNNWLMQSVILFQANFNQREDQISQPTTSLHCNRLKNAWCFWCDAHFTFVCDRKSIDFFRSWRDLIILKLEHCNLVCNAFTNLFSNWELRPPSHHRKLVTNSIVWYSWHRQVLLVFKSRKIYRISVGLWICRVGVKTRNKFSVRLNEQCDNLRAIINHIRESSAFSFTIQHTRNTKKKTKTLVAFV